MTSPIELHDLSKRYGRTTAVDALTFRVEPGRVTGFVGPNGAGKSTTMRMMLGLQGPTRGTALIGGRSYRTLRQPLCHVGALLDATAAHPARRARDHLRWLAYSNAIPLRRVDDVLGQVGLAALAERRAGALSLGERQRLGLAAALLGDPGIVVLDEPVNGLDIDGIRWIRSLLRQLAAQGRTVFVSSHLLGELEETADHLIIIGRGRLIADIPVTDLLAGGQTSLEDAYLRLTGVTTDSSTREA